MSPRGFTVGYLSQEPELDSAKDVKGNVMDGVAEVETLGHAWPRRVRDSTIRLRRWPAIQYVNSMWQGRFTPI